MEESCFKQPSALLIDKFLRGWSTLDAIRDEREFTHRQRRARVVHGWLNGGSVAEVTRAHRLSPGGTRYILGSITAGRGQREVLDAWGGWVRAEGLRRDLVVWSQRHRGVLWSAAGVWPPAEDIWRRI